MVKGLITTPRIKKLPKTLYFQFILTIGEEEGVQWPTRNFEVLRLILEYLVIKIGHKGISVIIPFSVTKQQQH